MNRIPLSSSCEGSCSRAEEQPCPCCAVPTAAAPAGKARSGQGTRAGPCPCCCTAPGSSGLLCTSSSASVLPPQACRVSKVQVQLLGQIQGGVELTFEINFYLKMTQNRGFTRLLCGNYSWMSSRGALGYLPCSVTHSNAQSPSNQPHASRRNPVVVPHVSVVGTSPNNSFHR